MKFQIFDVQHTVYQSISRVLTNHDSGRETDLAAQLGILRAHIGAFVSAEAALIVPDVDLKIRNVKNEL
jgi:hypothetical protein